MGSRDSLDDRERVLLRTLGLQPHPEGGWFVEHYREAAHAATAIYYLLPPGARSAWHRLEQDELWHHYEGAPVELHLIWPQDRWPQDPPGAARYERLLLGPVRGTGAEDGGVTSRPVRVVPAGVWQAARPVPGAEPGWSLVGNTVAPGFRFSDWQLADAATRARLAAEVPAAAEALDLLGPVGPVGGNHPDGR